MSGKKISYATILAAKSGEAEAMTAILRHHMPYIVRFSKRSFYDDYGNHYETVNEDVRQHIVSKLMEGRRLHYISRKKESLVLWITKIL